MKDPKNDLIIIGVITVATTLFVIAYLIGEALYGG